MTDDFRVPPSGGKFFETIPDPPKSEESNRAGPIKHAGDEQRKMQSTAKTNYVD